MLLVKVVNIRVHHATIIQQIVSVVHNLLTEQYFTYSMGNAFRHVRQDITRMTLESVINVMGFV